MFHLVHISGKLTRVRGDKSVAPVRTAYISKNRFSFIDDRIREWSLYQSVPSGGVRRGTTVEY